MRKADNLPPFCAVVTKSGNLNFLEPSGPLQACNGTALPALPALPALLVHVTLCRKNAELLLVNLVVEWKRNLVAHGDAREEK